MLKIGHRGAKAYAAENSLNSFKKAMTFGVDMIECDVRMTRDQYPVVIHDNHLRRLTKTVARVDTLTLAELKQLRLKRSNESIPTLSEMVAALGDTVGLNIELKVRDSAQVVVQTLRHHKVDFKRVMISSNFPDELRSIKALEPTIKTALLFRAPSAWTPWLVADFLALLCWPLTHYYLAWLVGHAQADYLNINHRFLSPEKIALFKRRGIKVCAWTVNSQRKIDYLKHLGVDGIITNYPDRL